MLENNGNRWTRPDGSIVACTEKMKVLNENYVEIKQLLQDAIDDAVLMGCSEKSFKEVYMYLLTNLKSEYPEIRKKLPEEKK